MKQRVHGLSSVFRRRGKNKAAAEAAESHLSESDTNHDYPSTSQISIVPSSDKVIDFTKGDHGATAANDRPEATMKTTRRLQQEDHGDNSMSSTYSDELEAVGIGHLSLREQMWYKNQMYLLAKQKDEAEAAHRHTPSRISSRYATNDRGADHYTAGINKHRDSPKGVNDFDGFESENMYRNVKHCDSRKEVRFGKNYHRSSQVSQYDDDTQTNQSSSLFDEDETCTNQSSSLFDDDTRTDQSSSLFREDDTRTDASEMNFDEVTLGSITLGSTTLEDTMTEGESFLASPDDATSMSYIFELIDDDKEQHRRYQLGVGQNSNTSSKSRRGIRKAATPSSNQGASKGRRVTEHAPRGRRGKKSTDDADFTDAVCPLLPGILEEISGTYTDVKSAFDQVLYACFISEDDIDRIADKVRDAKLEIIETYHEQKAKKSSRHPVHFD